MALPPHAGLYRNLKRRSLALDILPTDRTTPGHGRYVPGPVFGLELAWLVPAR